MFSSIKKTLYYAKRNGVGATLDAVRERLWEKRHRHYRYEAPTEEELEKQRSRIFERPLHFDIVVPLYETPKVFLQDMILSVMNQSYEDFTLILADASRGEETGREVKSFRDQYGKIEYIRLKENRGISGNTNEAIAAAKGDYVLLLDHDDVITPDALYCMREMIRRKQEKQVEPVLLFSDEDKADTWLDNFFEPNIKHRFDAEMLYTNNYICHLSAFRRDVIQKLQLRPDYDGAQDYDLVLRAVAYAMEQDPRHWRESIVHIPRVLYHWRSHEASTATNPASKAYAYDAGKRAIGDALEQRGIRAEVREIAHHGFYRVDYGEELFAQRPEVGAVGGPVYRRGLMAGGAMRADGRPVYQGLPRGFSGPCHRAAIQQEAAALDIRNICIRPELVPVYEKVCGCAWPQVPEATEEKLRSLSLDFGQEAGKQGFMMLYDPQMRER